MGKVNLINKSKELCSIVLVKTKKTNVIHEGLDKIG